MSVPQSARLESHRRDWTGCQDTHEAELESFNPDPPTADHFLSRSPSEIGWGVFLGLAFAEEEQVSELPLNGHSLQRKRPHRRTSGFEEGEKSVNENKLVFSQLLPAGSLKGQVEKSSREEKYDRERVDGRRSFPRTPRPATPRPRLPSKLSRRPLRPHCSKGKQGTVKLL